jgi:saccharopine dehydrogenase-like NADP-dependent oxidoreductase
MTDNILILGGAGRIGSHVAQDLAQYLPQTQITITGRNPQFQPASDRVQFLCYDLADRDRLKSIVSPYNLVIHCAGPFLYRDAFVLKTCIESGIDYLDVSDSPKFVKEALTYRSQAQAAGVTAILSSGVFPGISNSMVRQGVEHLDRVDHIHLSYVVSGSGGAGITVMRTTFLGLQQPFSAWIDGDWRSVQPYSQRERIEFPEPYGKVGVYWFDVPETATLPMSFPCETVVTKFGSIPDFYNHLTWAVARFFPSRVLQNKVTIEFLSKVSYQMTQVTDQFTGIGVAMRAKVEGKKAGKAASICLSFAHENTVIAAGVGTGSIAQLLRSGALKKPGVWSVEEALPTPLFQQALECRGLVIQLTVDEA